MDYEIEDVDDMVKDKQPEEMPDADYDKKNPPMAVGTVYSDMKAFKLALATHAMRGERHYDIEASDKTKYRVSCRFKKELGCMWRIHASTTKDGRTVKVH